MNYLVLVLVTAALGVLVVQARSAPGDGVPVEAKTAFLKKCFRDRTGTACEAPAAARVKR